MHSENLHELIRRYEEKLDTIYGNVQYELFKWQAVKTWQEEWLKPADSFGSFGKRYSAAKKDLSWFMDNSRMHPSTGLLKLWEKEPDTVERLFTEFLLRGDGDDIDLVQERMDAFLDSYEQLRQRYFPGNWSYKQDRHSASVYLALNEPSFHYVYKCSEALTMARYIDFGIAIGSGSHFRLASYYRMCDEIVAALKEHPSLLEQHFARLDPRCWVDKSLHLLAFDLIWCSSTNHLYHGLTVPSTVRSAKKSSSAGQRSMETQQKIDALRQEIEDLEAFPDDTADISLLGVQVTSPQYGTGTVVGQNANKIDVQFGSLRKSFVLDEAYPARPRFEDDEAIVKAFTVYGRRCSRINALKRQLDALRR